MSPFPICSIEYPHSWPTTAMEYGEFVVGRFLGSLATLSFLVGRVPLK